MVALPPLRGSPLRLLVTGGSGCVGRAVLRRLRECHPNVRVWATVRRGTRLIDAPAMLRMVLADLEELAIGKVALPTVDVVVHAAAFVHRSRESLSVFLRGNRDAVAGLHRASQEGGALRRFVFVSSIAAEEGATPYGRSKREAEDVLLGEAASAKAAIRIVRLATVYGAGDRGNIARMFRAVATRRYVRLVSDRTKKSLLKVERAAAALVAAALHEEPLPVCTTLADPRPYSLGEIEAAMAGAAGLPLPPRIPSWFGETAATAGSILSYLPFVRPPLTRAVLATMKASVEVMPGPLSPITEAADAVPLLPLAQAFAIYRKDKTPRPV